MDKEAVVHVYNGILLGHKKEHIWVSSNEVNEPRAYYTEWNKSEKNKCCILTHIYGIYKDGTDKFICRAAMEKLSSTLAWQIPWTEEPGRLQSMGSRRVGHDWATSLSLSTFMHWRRQWQPTPVFLPGESHGWRSLVGCSPWARTESDTTEATWQRQCACCPPWASYCPHAAARL